MKYASDTSVSVEKSRAEIERLVQKYGASRFMSGWDESRAVIGFQMCGRALRFTLELPDRQSKAFTTSHRGSRARTESQAYQSWEQACRQRWRALALVVKAKLEAVSSGITTFEHEFMAHMVMPDGKTFAEHAIPAINQALSNGRAPQLLIGM
jgi:hypothetical protein